MPKFRLTALAKADLKAIARFTERRWGRERRNDYLRQFDESFHRLAHNPDIGQDCAGLRPGYRRFPVGRHHLFYRLGADGTVEIIRILHQRMDAAVRLED
jgi:toxin ParE1/3/4